ncbi:MAG: universal stress protein, partial [Pseudomonadota bacterium]
LNEWIIEAGHVIGEKGNFEIHAAHSYTVEGLYYDRRALAKQCGLPLERVHDSADIPHKGIVKIAREVKPDLVLIGTRQNASGLHIGDTVERALDGLPMDVLVMPVLGFRPA